MEAYELLGWIGTVLIVGAYFLNSTNRIPNTSRAYQLMNLFGAIGVGVSVYYQEAWPAVALQATWGLIAIYSPIKK